MQRQIRLRVLLRRERTMWVAQCLEHDIAAQGPNIREAQRAFLTTLAAQVRSDLDRGREPLRGIPPAPEEYFRAFELSVPVGEPLEEKVPTETPPAYQIDALQGREFRVYG